MSTVLYRFEDQTGVVMLRTFRPVRTTPCGHWIEDRGRRRFVLNDSTKRFAYPTKEEAKVSFLARKNRQLGILKAQAENVEIAIKAMKEGRLQDHSHIDNGHLYFDD